MVEFLIERDLLASLFKFGCITKTKGKGIIDTLRVTVDNNKLIMEGVDPGFTIVSCVRAGINKVIEPGSFIYSPINLLGKLQSFGSELSVRTDGEKIYVTDLDNVTTFTDILPNVDVNIPVGFEFEDVLVPKVDELKPTHKVTVLAELPKFDSDVVLSFSNNKFSIGVEDEITSFKKNFGIPELGLAEYISNASDELKVRVNGNYLDKILSLIKPPFVIGACENAVYIYARFEYGDVAYITATIA